MPSRQLHALLGRSREDEDPVFLLVRRRDPILDPLAIPKQSGLSTAVSILLVVATILALVALLWGLR